MYKKALLLKLRFDSSIGRLSVEQLMEMKLSSKILQTIATNLKAELDSKGASTLDFLDDVVDSADASHTQLKFDIVKDIILTKKAEMENKTNEKARQARIAELNALISDKKNEVDKSKSVEELEKELATLKA